MSRWLGNVRPVVRCTNWSWNVWFIVDLVLTCGSALSLLQQLVSFCFSSHFISFECFCPFDDTVKETFLAGELGVGFRPRDIHLSIFLQSNNTDKAIVVGVIYVGDLIRDLFSSWLLNSINFERIFRASKLFHVVQQHLVISSPVLMWLLEEHLWINFGISTGKVLPPVLWLLWFHVQRQFLSMNSNSLVTKLLCVLFNHLLASLLGNVSICFSFGLLLLHS